MIRPGEPWGTPATSGPDVEVAGDDAALAAAVVSAPGVLVRFRPSPASDLARAVGLAPGAPEPAPGTAAPLDALALGSDGLACNMCVLGTPPDRLRWLTPSVPIEVVVDGAAWFSGPATTVVVANGQFLRGRDVVPRGHPGDGRAEIQVYALARGERRGMRSRLGPGAHVPHPRIHGRSGRRFEVRAARALPLDVDGVARAPRSVLQVDVLPAAYRLLI